MKDTYVLQLAYNNIHNILSANESVWSNFLSDSSVTGSVTLIDITIEKEIIIIIVRYPIGRHNSGKKAILT